MMPRKYKQYWIEFYPNGKVRKSQECVEPSSDGRFYDNLDGFGGVVTAKSFPDAIKKVKAEIQKRRGQNDR